jgi:hypothetical protein
MDNLTPCTQQTRIYEVEDGVRALNKHADDYLALSGVRESAHSRVANSAMP